ncbi:MAG: sensor histidine kinase KdpD [Syntrophaceae bacterium]|nr:sensor histidine kinase KdpD [Syntrophaceae bacterium]
MEDRRPDPDALLDQAKREEEQRRQGKLKIFFGAAPGVGKTYAMLEAAGKKREEGIDIVAGIVETHGRRETEQLLEGIETLPRRNHSYKGSNLREFDLDAALARRPAILLVDELAHTNVPGARHGKRWQDVRELLHAGISVYTTVNVQHLESLNDIVYQITGVVVRETVPDSFLDKAEEIELIDLPPDDLLQRLKEGKVYVPEQARKAMDHFFRKGNLLALRELALRRTAERVDEQMQRYRRDQGVRAIWPVAERILVCVGPNPRSVRLIRAARRMAAGLRAEWLAVNVEAPSHVRATAEDKRLLAEHLRLAESLGAEAVTLTGRRVSEEILSYARSRNVSRIIVGKPTHARWKDKILGSPLDEIVRGSGDIDVYVITGDAPEQDSRPAGRRPPTAWKASEWIRAAAAVAASTVLSAILFPYLELLDLAMIYLLGIVATAVRTSRWPTLLAAFFSVAAFDFFFVPPYYTFAVADARYIVTFGVMFVVALVISGLTLRVREQAEAARGRERKTAALYGLSRDLARLRKKDGIGDVAARHIGGVFRSSVAILLSDEEGRLVALSGGADTYSLDEKEMGVAQWVLENRQAAGLGTQTLPGARALYLPMIASSGPVGVIGILPADPWEWFDPEQVHLLETFANQTAMTMERVNLAKEAHRERMNAEAQALRNVFLNAVSHDLRTPLAVIGGAADTLLRMGDRLPAEKREELAGTIQGEAERLHRIVRNVLSLTRLESGAVKVRRDWQSMEEIAGAVIGRLQTRLKGHPLYVRIPEDLPLILFDPLLMEQILTNLLENATQHTPMGTPVELSVQAREKDVLVEVADRGPGIPAGQEERIFEKFSRVRDVGSGVGLGLAICRAAVEAHGGHIWVENRPGGGASFRFTFPLGENPELPVAGRDS